MNDEEKQKVIEDYFNQMMDDKINYGDCEDESNEKNGGIPIEVLEEIRDKKNKGMFVSGWENDENDLISKNMDDPIEQFLTAAEEGNLDLIKEKLNNDISLKDAHDRDGYTAMHRAAYSNHMDIVKYLIFVGASPEAKTNEGWSVLHSAAYWGNYDIVGVLISHGMDVNVTTNGMLTPLHCALNSESEYDKRYLTIKYLLEAPGVDVGIVSNGGQSPLQMGLNHNEYIRKLFEKFSSSFITDEIASAYNHSAPLPFYITKEQLDQRQKDLLAKIDTNNEEVCEDDHYYYEAHGLKTKNPTKYCMACRCVAPRRAHHCPICDICILRKDHHCFFTGGCIGLANQRYFMMFCFWAGLGALYGVTFTVTYMHQFVAPAFPYGFVFWVSPIAFVRWLIGIETFPNVFIGTFFTLTLSTVIGAWGFFSAQCFYTYHGFTMYDYHEGRLRDHIESDGDTVLERIKLIFGKHWYLNIIFPLFWERNEIQPKTAKNIFLSISKDL
uniref:Palmitoyltransferase n=1 Tax=Parastrongyloides trichosuri TaxID=131310 RepID=A0A0N4ZRA6_PARTI